MRDVLRQLRRATLGAEGDNPTDGQLMEAFVSRRDETAFGALVQRHGPMVLGVCRRVLGNFHDAEDAFQATFLVLARKASSVRPPEAVGNWLHGVAYRTALQARWLANRRRAQEKQARAMRPPPAETQDPSQELRLLLDRELSRLPQRYRAAVVLCELEGRSRKEVAVLLGIPEGTLSSRLASARKMLARRLARYRVALSATALATALAGELAASAVPEALLAATTGLGTGAVPRSAQVPALAERVIKAMFLAKLRNAVAVMVVLGLLAGVALAARSWGRQQEPPPPNAPAAPSPPKRRPVHAPPETPREKGVPEGTWRMTSVRVGGKRIFEGSEQFYTIEVTKTTLTWKTQGVPVSSVLIKVNTGKRPAWIDQTFTSGPGKGKMVRGIFEVKDAVLTISHGSENGDRPANFQDPRGITRTFKRESP